jgi:hypothetical protein
MSNDIIVLDVKDTNNYLIFDINNINKISLPDIFVVCTQNTDSRSNNFQKKFKFFANNKDYILLDEYKTGGFMSNISIQTNIYIKKNIDKNNIKNIKKDSIYINSDNSIQYLYFEYYFHKLKLFNQNIKGELKEKMDLFIKKYIPPSKNNYNDSNNNDSNNNDSNNYYFLGSIKNEYIRNNNGHFGGGKSQKLSGNINGYYIVYKHDNNKNIKSLTIININENGKCFDNINFNTDYNTDYNTDLIIVCSQNSISRKLGCKNFQTLLRENIEKGQIYKLKNKKNSSGLVNISRHVSIGELGSLGIRTRVYFKQGVDPSLLNITFKSINFTDSYGSILCSIEYNGQKIHVINSCFFDKKTLGIFKKSYKNEKLDEYMKIIKEFELVKKINDDLFFVGHNIKFNLQNNNSENKPLRNRLNYLNNNKNKKNKIIQQFKGYNNYIQSKYSGNKYKKNTSNIFYNKNDKKIKVEILTITF